MHKSTKIKTLFDITRLYALNALVKRKLFL